MNGSDGPDQFYERARIHRLCATLSRDAEIRRFHVDLADRFEALAEESRDLAGPWIGVRPATGSVPG